MPQKPPLGTQALRKGRHSQTNGIYFITTATHGRIPWFQQFDLASIMSRCMLDPKCFPDARNLCWVVMPDHVHVLVQLGETPLSEVVRRLKAKSALLLNREIGRKGRFWDAAFHDHGLRKEESVRGIARYIVGNPLRAGLVTNVGDYPYWHAIWL